jgi:hypothetical protein
LASQSGKQVTATENFFYWDKNGGREGKILYFDLVLSCSWPNVVGENLIG